MLGAPCTVDGDCTGGYLCDTEFKYQVAFPGGANDELDRVVTPGGFCTPKKRANFDPATDATCTPLAKGAAQGCGADGGCAIINGVAGNPQSEYPVVGCRKTCEPSKTASGCDRAGYTCDIDSSLCVEACISDQECRIQVVDEDGDGIGDALRYDAASGIRCSTETGRCEHGSGAKKSGESCERSDDCVENGLCIGEFDSAGGHEFPDGLCTQTSCDGFYACDNGTVCQALRPWLGAPTTVPMCFTSCTVGAEPAADRIGTSGHGSGCRAGYRCHYNGGSGAQSGVCVGGEYNAVTTSNIGSTCKTSADCYSPFGLGYCAIYQTSAGTLPGICTVLDCAAPGIPRDVCGGGNQCLATPEATDGDLTMCAHDCKSATECPVGFACTDDDTSSLTPKVCSPLCAVAADCREGETCQGATETTFGLCSAGG